MTLAALASRVRMVLKDLVQMLDAMILEVESKGVLLTRSMSSSSTGLGRIPTQSCSLPGAPTVYVRAFVIDKSMG